MISENELIKRHNALRFRQSGRHLAVAFVNPQIGMFAQMNFCLYMAWYAEASGQSVHITLNSQNYLDPDHGPSWFEYFFFHVHKHDSQAGWQTIDISDNDQLPFQVTGLDLVKANALFFRNYGIREEITRSVDKYVVQNAIGLGTLGVHYRGTDKYSEADIVPIPVAIDKIEAAIKRYSPKNIFVSSEDARFIRAAYEQVKSVPLHSCNDSIRSEGSAPVHRGGLRRGNYAMGRDAILNALILSRCGRLVRTTSFLSAWSSVFNPNLSVSLLNCPRPDKLWFPESLIVGFAERL
jgi:hypothetical protein